MNEQYKKDLIGFIIVSIGLFLMLCYATGCSYTPIELEEKEYRQIEEISILREQWINCIQNGNSLYINNPRKYYLRGIHNTPSKRISISDARNTYCLYRDGV